MTPEEYDGMTKLLQDFTAAKKARVWNLGDGKEFGVTEAFGSDMPRSPRDDEGRLIAGPDARVVPMDEEALRGRYSAGKPVRRMPIEPQAQPAQASAPAAAPQQSSDGGGGWDWSRAMAGLVHGPQGIQAVDAGRASRAQTKLAQDREGRAAELDAITLDDHKRKTAMLRDASDPASQTSADMRAELVTGFGVLASDMPHLKPTLDALSARVGNMSATGIAAMQERMGKIFDMARRAAHDRATEAMAGKKLEQGERQIQATLADKAEGRAIARMGLMAKLDELALKRQEREDNVAEKDAASLGKDLAPLNETGALLAQAKEQKKKVNTGFWINKIRNGLKYFGIHDTNALSLEATISTVDNQITKLQSGGNVTDNEAQRLRQQLAMLDQDDPEFDIKLAQMMDTIRIKTEQATKSHPRAAARAAERENTSADGGGSKPSDGAAKVKLAREALADPEATAEDKAAAKRILEKYGE